MKEALVDSALLDACPPLPELFSLSREGLYGSAEDIVALRLETKSNIDAHYLDIYGEEWAPEVPGFSENKFQRTARIAEYNEEVKHKKCDADMRIEERLGMRDAVEAGGGRMAAAGAEARAGAGAGAWTVAGAGAAGAGAGAEAGGGRKVKQMRSAPLNFRHATTLSQTTN